MSLENDFDRTLQSYAYNMRGYQKSIALAKDCLFNARIRRITEEKTDAFYQHNLRTAASSRETARIWWSMARKDRNTLQSMFRNSYYDHVYETQYAVA